MTEEEIMLQRRVLDDENGTRRWEKKQNTKTRMVDTKQLGQGRETSNEVLQSSTTNIMRKEARKQRGLFTTEGLQHTLPHLSLVIGKESLTR
jgi:hypothetical protein